MLKKIIQKYQIKKDIKHLAYLITSEGMFLAQKIVERLPLDANDNELIAFCDRVEKKYIKEKNSLITEFTTCIKISFEWSCYQLSCFDHTFREKKWDFAYEILFDEILKIYTEAFRDIYEFDVSANPKIELKKMLHNKINLNNAIYSNTDWSYCVGEIEKLNNKLIKDNSDIKISESSESKRVFNHFMDSFSNGKISNALVKIKS